MASKSITIRAADVSDARELAGVAEATFRDTFATENSAEDMDAFCKARYGEPIQAAEIANPNMSTLLCEQDRSLIGFAQLRFGEAPSCVVANAPAEIQRLYVAKAFHGLGVAHRLMKESLAEMSRLGVWPVRQRVLVWLGVWERNFRATAFYRKFGFVEVGDHVFTLGSDRQRDIVMARAVVDFRAAT